MIWTNASVGYLRKFHNATGIRHLETLLHWTLSYAASFLCSVSGVDCPSILPRQLLFCSVSGVDCPSVDPRQLPLLLLASLLSSHQLLLPLSASRRQLSFTSPYHFRVRRDFRSKNPLSGFAPKQTIESSALAAYPHSATDESATWFQAFQATRKSKK